MTQINYYIDPPTPERDGRPGVWHRDGFDNDGKLPDEDKAALLEELAYPPKELHLHIPLLPTAHTYLPRPTFS